MIEDLTEDTPAVTARQVVMGLLAALANEHEREASIAKHDLDRITRQPDSAVRDARLSMATSRIAHHASIAQYARKVLAASPDADAPHFD